MLGSHYGCADTEVINAGKKRNIVAWQDRTLLALTLDTGPDLMEKCLKPAVAEPGNIINSDQPGLDNRKPERYHGDLMSVTGGVCGG